MSDPRLACAPGDVVLGLGLDRRSYTQAINNAEEALADAMVATYESITGKKANDCVREALWSAVRGEVG